MNCPETTTLHDLVDDELALERRDAVERHLDGCARCRAEVEAVRALLDDAARLPRRIDPPRELWSRIEARAHARSRPGVPRPAVWLAAAAVATLLFAAWFAIVRPANPARSPSIVASAAERDAPDAALPASTGDGDDLARLTEAYVDATRRLLDALDARGAGLQGQDRAEFDRSLALIDAAIAEVRIAVDRRPDDPERQRTLRALYQQKVDVLWRVSRLTS